MTKRLLGSKVGGFKTPEEARLEWFPNPKSEREYEVVFTMPKAEMMCNCEVTNQPDFYYVRIAYVPDKRCLESKSLKLYLQSFKNVNAFCERLTNRVADDIIKAINPKSIRVSFKMVPRGGIDLETIVAEGQ